MPINQTPPLESLYKAARGRGVEFAEEFVPTTRTFDASELRLSYTEWGDPGLPTVVMLHGFAQTSHAWDLITLGLADRFHLISLDQRGHGDSQWATDGDYSLETQQQDLDEFIKSLGVRRLILVGLSMGGRNAYVFASRNPQLISNLVVVDTGPQGIRSGRSRIRNFVTMPDELDTFEEFVERVHSYVPHRSLEQISNSLLNNIRQMENGKWTWKYDRLLRDPNYRRQAASQDQLWAYWESVKCPSLIIRGGNSDVLASETVAEMTSRNLFSESAVVPESGHLVPGDNPAGFLRVIRPWLLERV
jgi:pimeloyl-ACP methyl ester carboxylesterase|tara:strand:+ start:2222 stop:3133 length:912 start_codon:yes stop_codon:yes gene_type:complete